MPPKKRALGRGLEALLPQKPPQKTKPSDVKTAAAAPAEVIEGGVTTLAVTAIRRNDQQPRQYFDEEALHQLADSIKRRGIIQPVAVMKRENDYVLVAGERRWRAAQIAGIQELPVIILDSLSSQDLLEYALVENLQRENLNAMEEARAYQTLQRSFSLTAENIAERMGKSRSAIANSLRLLTLPPDMQEDLEAERITAGHARAILSLENQRDQVALRNLIVQDNMSVRQAELKAREMTEGGAKRRGKARKPKAAAAPSADQAYLDDIREQLIDVFACQVTITSQSDDRGKIEIHYESLDELQNVLDILEIQT